MVQVDFLGDISYPLTLLLQRILEDREVPDEWREANVVPVLKNGSRGEKEFI